MQYKLKTIMSDMWSRVTFIDVDDNNKEWSFECENNQMYALLKASLPKDTIFNDKWTDMLSEIRPEYPKEADNTKFRIKEIVLSNGHKNGRWEVSDEFYESKEWSDYCYETDKFDKEFEKRTNELIKKHKNDQCIYTDEMGCPAWDYDYPHLFTKDEIYHIINNIRTEDKTC